MKFLKEKIKDEILSLIWNLRKIPYSMGYGSAKKKKIIQFLKNDKKELNIYNVKGMDERLIEYKWIFNHIAKVKSKKILDAGSTLNFDFLLERLDISNKIYIQTLFSEIKNYNNLNVSYIYEDLISSIFKENYFDYITCISTLEHIGFDNSFYNYNKLQVDNNKIDEKKYLDVINEFKRILKTNGKLLLTIPFGKKIKYQHLQQFDIFDIEEITKVFDPKNKNLNFFTYKNHNWIEVNHEECAESEIRVDYTKQTHDKLASSRSICFLELIK